MGQNIVEKVMAAHRVSGSLTPGSEVAITIDHTLLQDATGTMALLQFEAIGVPRVKTKRSVAYVDHNTIQPGFEGMDDQLFIESACRRFGLYFSRAGNGICHQVNLERFSVPGDTLLGIAIKNRMKTEALCELNGLKRGSALKPGRKLRVRGSASVAESQGISREASGNLDLYKVRKGDTLWGLARKHETSTEVICRLNGLTKEATLKPEMEIKVPSGL